MGMFDFLLTADNYESRKVARFDAEWGFISTAYVNDADQAYETAIKHREYNSGKIVIVEAYDTKDEARAGHDRWIAVMTTEVLPERLIDRGSAGIAQMVDVFAGDEDWRVKPRTQLTTTEVEE